MLEPNHTPAHRGQFAPFEHAFYTGLTDRHGLVDLFRHLHPDRVEHSWARRPELGYRYDHAHGSRVLAERLTSCDYVHETRQASPDGSRLTDHYGDGVAVAGRPNDLAGVPEEDDRQRYDGCDERHMIRSNPLVYEIGGRAGCAMSDSD